jgi:glutamate-1-semialdehyde 2,1-aminomutase
MAMFGKALGNGYAITATIGRREIMEAAQSSFISSTFWTERIGPSAALKTLEVMKRIESWEIISDIGARVQAKWSILGKEHGINVVSSGLPALSNISFNEDDPAAYRTLMTQEMLKRGYLTSGNFYPSICHTSDVLEEYFANLDEVFRLISECKQSNAVTSHLNGPVAHSGFKRLN